MFLVLVALVVQFWFICFTVDLSSADKPQALQVHNELMEAADMLNEEEVLHNNEDVDEDDNDLLRLPAAQRQLYLRIKRNQRQIEDQLNRNEELVTAGKAGELSAQIW